MKKFDTYSKCLDVLLKADRKKAEGDALYRMGVIGQFNLTFELACKAVKELLEFHGILAEKIGLPREIFKAAYEVNFVDDEAILLEMLRRRNISVHLYDEEKAIELVNLIFDNYISALVNLKNSLSEKIPQTDDV